MSMRIRVLVRAVVLSAMVACSSSTFCATVTWDAGGDGISWSSPANWDTNSLPTASDDVIMANVGGLNVLVDVTTTVNSMTVHNGKQVQVDVGQVLTLNNASTVNSGGALGFNGADLTVNGALTVNGVLNVYGGTLGGSGTLAINGGATMIVLITANTPVISVPTSNAGTIIYLDSGSPGPNFIFSGATLTNTGIIDIQTDQGIDPGLGSPILNNNSGGVIKKTVGSGTATITFPVDNQAGGTIQVQSGILSLDGGGTGSGTYSISAGKVLHLGGGTLSLTGSPTFSGTGSLVIAGGTLNAGAGVTLNNVGLRPGGTITGTGAVDVSGSFEWYGGTITGIGPRVLTSTSVPSIGCLFGNCLLDGAALQLQASATFSAPFNALVFANGASLTIDSGETLAFTNDGDITNGGGAASSITNNGTIRKTTTAGTSTIGVPVTLSGTSTVDIDTGTLQFGGGATVAAGATLDIDAGRTLEVTGGVFLFNSGTVSMPGSGDFKVSAGTLRVPTSITATIPNVTLEGSGIIDGGGTLVLSGTSTWSGGTMGSATAPGGITRIDSGNTLNVTATGAKSLTQLRQLLNGGTVSYGATSPNSLTMSGNGKITNNGTLDLSPAAVINLSGSALIENNGTINKNGFGASQIFTPLDNNAGGTVSVNASTLALSGGGTERGAFTVAAGANLILGPGPAFTMLGSPTVSGPGTLTLHTLDVGDGPGGGSDVLTVGAPIVAFGTISLKDATLQASSTFSVSGTIQHYGGAISGSGTMTINNGAVLNSRGTDSASTIAINTTINSGGTLNFTDDVFQHGLSGNITVTNNGTIDFQSDGGLSSFSGAPQVVNNTGTLKKSAGSGTTGINVPVASNSGSTVQAASGTLAFNQGGNLATVTISGAGTVALPATAAVSGTTTLTGNLQLTGSAAVSGTLNAAGTLLLDNGVNVTWPNVNLSAAGSKIDGAGTLNVSGNFTWAGGTIAGSGARVLTGTSVPAISCSAGNCLLDGATLQLQASGTYSASSNAIVLSNGASLVLDPGRGLHVNNDGDFLNGGGAPSSIVIGGFSAGYASIHKTTTSGTSIIGVPVTLSGGAFNLDAGTLRLTAGVTVNAGTPIPVIDYDPGCTIEVTGGVFLFNANSSLPLNGDFKVMGGTLRVATGVTITMPNLMLESGVIDGGGDLHVSGNFNWSGGTIAGSGARVLNSSSTPAISCSAANCLLDGSTLRLQAWGTYSASSNALMLSNGASLILDPGQVLYVTNDGDFVSGGGAASSIVIGGFGPPGVNGCIEKTTTPGTSVIGIPVTMSGSFKTVTGTLQVAAGVTVAADGAIVHYDPGTTIEVTGGVFLIASGPVYFPANGNFKISAGTLRVPTGITTTIPNVTLQGSGVIDGGGTLILFGTSFWTGGTMGSATAPGGITQVPSGNTLNILGSTAPQSLTQTRQLLNNGTVSYGGIGANTLTMSGGTTITNNGTFNLTNNSIINNSPAGSAVIENNGTFARSSGSGGSTVEPRVENNNGATLSLITGTSVGLFGGGTADGAYSISSGATLTLVGGTFTVANTSTVTGAGTLAIDGATVDAGPGVDVTWTNVTLSSGTMTGAGTMHVSGNFNWIAGTISGSGAKVLDSTSTPTISCTAGGCLLDGATLQLQASATYSASSPTLVFCNGASLILDAGKTLNITNDGDIHSGCGAASSIINGKIWKHTTSGTSTLGVPMTLSGTSTVDVDTGTLQFGHDASVASGATIDVAAGRTIEVIGGVFLFNSGAVSMPGSGNFQVSAGTLRVPTGVTMDLLNVTLQQSMYGSGVIDGGGTLILSGTSSWTGGTMSGSGTTVIPAAMSLGISAPVTLDRTLQNGGTLNVSGDITGSGTIDNGGTLNALADLTLGVTVNNSGQVVTSNALSLAGGGTHTGSFSVTTPGSLSFTSGTHSMSGGSIGGTGTLAISGADVTVGSPFSLGALSVIAGAATLDANGSVDAFTMTGGTLGGNGILTLNNGGTWSGGTMSGSGMTVNPAAKTLSISAPVTLDSRTLQNGGTLNVSGDIAGSGTIDNGGTLNALADLTVGVTVNNSGQVVTSNALSLAGGGTHTGSFSVTTPGSLAFSSGTHSMSGGSIGGTGTLAISGADVTVGSPFTIGALSLTGGTATLDANGSADAFTMSGGTLGGSGILTLNNGGTWSGGAMSGSGTTVNPATKTLSISAPVTLDSRTLQNDGTLTVNGDITGSGTIDNVGTLDAVADLTIGTVVNNSGLVVTSNALSLAGGGTHTGLFGVTSPGILSFSSGTHSMSGGGSISGTGTLSFSGATATIGVPVNVGALNLSAGTATLDANGSADAFTMTGGTLGGSGGLLLNNGGTWSGGTISGSGTTINPAAMTLSISAPVTLNSRTLQNDGTLTVSGDITGSGTIANNGTLDAVGNSAVGVTVNNSGQLATSGALSLAGGGTHTGSFNVTTPGNLSFSSGAHSVSGGGSIGGSGTLTFSGASATIGVPVNVGTMSVTAGTATLDANASAGAFTMNGGTLAGSGTLTLSNGGTWSGGTMSGAATTINQATLSIPASVTLNGRTLQNDGTLTVSGNVAGSGTIANNGTLDAAGDSAIGTALNNSGHIAAGALLSLGGNGAHSGTFTVTAPGAIDFSGGTQTISGSLAGTGMFRFSGAAATVSGTWSGMAIEVAGGSVALDTNGTIPALTLSGGTLAGSGELTVSGPSTWSGGTIAGSGALTFDSGATVTMSGAVTLVRPLMNQGTINFTAASNGMHIAGVEVTNHGTIDIQSSQGITAAAGTPPFVNYGTLQKSSGSGVMMFAAPLSNGGQVRIESGTMQFGGGYEQSAGTTAVLSGATLKTATLSLNGGALTGNGTVEGKVANNATVSPGASPGTLTINGNYVQSPNGVLKIQLDGPAPGTEYDQLLVSGSVTLGGTLDVTTGNGFTPTPGNAFQIIAFGSRFPGSTFAVMNGLTGSGTALAPTFSANDLQLIASLPPAADVRIGVTGPLSTTAGTKAIYTITVSNSGPDTATSVAVTATASPGLTFSGNSGACLGSFPCNIGTLSAGQSVTIHTAWDIAASATGSVQLTVNANSAADANASNNSASAITSIGACPAITIVAPGEMTAGAAAEATATLFDGATYSWSIVNGTIDSGDGTAGIAFTAGEAGTATLAVNVTGGGCALGATFDVTVKPLLTCVGTATPTEPADGTTADATVSFAWTAVDGASGYRLWLQQDDAPARSLGTSLGTSRTKIIAPGAYRWYVETLFDGCASHESERRTLTILPAEDCASRGAPQLSAPANEIPAASAAVAFSWNAVAEALEYELWLAPAGGVPTLIHTTADTSYTAVVPPGRLEWYVRAVFGGCAATESAHRVFTYTPPPECTSERPLLIAPIEGDRLTSPVSFEWTSVSGATSYELYVDGVLAATTTSPRASALPMTLAERRWQVRARLAEGCGAVDSAESRLVVIPAPPSCTPLGAPVLSAPSQISSGVAGRIQWSSVAGATFYVVEISGDPGFPREATSSSAVTTPQMPFTFTNPGSMPVARYLRVYAVDANCVQPSTGAFSPVAMLLVVPSSGSEGAALLTDPTGVQYTLNIDAEFAGQSFTATPTVPWISVTPASGIVPPGGQTLRAVAHTAALPPGTSTGGVEFTTTAGAGSVRTHATTPPPKITIPVNNIPGVAIGPKSTPPPDSLIIPAVASVTNFIVTYDSDISVTNTSAQVMKYEIDFVPTGPAGLSEGQKTSVSLEPGATMAINDIVATWFGGRSSTGTLEIRPLTEVDTSTSSAPVGGLAYRTTFASSRTFSTTSAGGTYGQYIPAVPYANFVAKGSTLSLQHIAQSKDYRTNLGLVEGSGEKVSLEVRIFDAAGTKRASFPVNLNGGERAQLNAVLAEHGVTLDDGRIEVEVMDGAGKVTAYASVIDNVTNDPQLVPPVHLGHAGHSKWVIPGVADLVSGSGHWQTDVRIFNAGTEPAELTLAFYSMNGGPATTRTIQLAAGEVRQFDRVLSFFAISGDAGALHVSSAVPAQVVATARTYSQTDDGAYGQFIVAATPDEAVAVGSRPLQILQMEESKRFKANIGFAEVSGKPVTLEVAVFRPNSNTPSLVEVKLEPNQFRQMNSLLSSLGLGEMFNARISVRAVSGEGRALAYGSLIDHKTGDPTFIPGQ